jgi:hypothetical protein
VPQKDEPLTETWDAAARREMEETVLEIVRHVERRESCRVLAARVAFILDDNHQTWLTHLTDLHMQPKVRSLHK